MVASPLVSLAVVSWGGREGAAVRRRVKPEEDEWLRVLFCGVAGRFRFQGCREDFLSTCHSGVC